MPPIPAEPPTSAGSRAVRRIRSAAVAVFVVWQLVFLLWRNVADHWPDLAPDRNSDTPAARFNRLSERFAGTLALEQGWGMFGSPVSRNSPFPAVRIEFADGSGETVLSDNEPADPAAFFRFGGVRDRRLEDYLVAYADKGTRSRERPLWEAYLRRAVKMWSARHPEDGRRPVRAVMLSRDYFIPPPEGTRLPRTPAVSELFTLELTPGDEPGVHPDGRPRGDWFWNRWGGGGGRTFGARPAQALRAEPPAVGAARV